MKKTTAKNILAKTTAAAVVIALIAGADAWLMNDRMTALHASAAATEAAGEEEPSPADKNELMKNAASDLAAKYGTYLESASQTAKEMREEALKAVKEEDASLAQEWLDTLVEQFDENDIQGSTASCFTEESSEEEMIAVIQLLSAVYQGEISTEILSFDNGSIHTVDYEDTDSFIVACLVCLAGFLVNVTVSLFCPAACLPLWSAGPAAAPARFRLIRPARPAAAPASNILTTYTMTWSWDGRECGRPAAAAAEQVNLYTTISAPNAAARVCTSKQRGRVRDRGLRDKESAGSAQRTSEAVRETVREMRE